MKRGPASAIIVVAAAALYGGAAHARSNTVLPYALADVWPAAIRFLRVDRDYVIKEKDDTAGYVIFEVVENKKTYRGTLELVAASDSDGRANTQVVVTLGELPRHYEVALLDKLGAKLREERGPPPAPPSKRPPPPPATPDAGPGKPPTTDPSGLPKPPVWGPEVR